MDSGAGHEASDDDSDHKYYLDGTDTSKAEAALKAKLSRKRTKTGCLTCRKRRIKCGEERPMCKNCIKSKRHCEWRSAYYFPGWTDGRTNAFDASWADSAVLD
jgi:hypothetical protein